MNDLIDLIEGNENRRITNEKNVYLTVFESFAYPVIMLDPSNKIINLNHEAARLFDPATAPGTSYYQPHQPHQGKTGGPSLIGKNVLDVFPWLGPVMEEPVSRPSGEKITEVGAVINGEQKYFEVKYSQMLDVSKKFTATILTVRDVTDQKMAEEKLKWSEKNLANAQRIAHLGSWEMDIATGESYWSDEFFRICGLEPGSIRPNAEFGLQIIHPDDRERAAKAVEQAVAQGKQYKIEKRIVLPGGTVRDILSQGEIIYDEKKQPLKMVGSFLDITDRKKIEADLRKAKEAAEAASRAKSQFLSTMSHEIRTPLNAVIGMGEVLSETPLNVEQQQFLRISNTAGEDLLAIINDILDISKIETGHFELESIPFNLREVVEKTCEILAVRAHKKGLELSAHVHNNASLHLEGDPYRLRQVLINLIGNAIKFTEKGQVEVEVQRSPLPKPCETGREEKNLISILFTVTDTGIGIPLDKQENIFESFAQVDSSTTRKYGGTGLGLAISTSLVEMMGGSIGVHSDPDRGSRFFFEVVFKFLQEEEKAAPGTKLPPDAAVTPDPREFPAARLLLVEDSVPNQTVVEAFLKGSPVSIDIADNGKIALEKFKNNPYHLVLMDVQMPVMDGLTATREIRKWEKENNRAPTPILAMTAHALVGDIHKSINAGCDTHLSKPIKRKNFLEVVGKYLRDAVPETVSPPQKPPPSPGDKIVVHVDPILKPYLPGFLKSLRQNVALITQCLEQGDFEKIRAIGHQVKGDSGTYGLESAGKLGALIQKAAPKQKADEIRRLVDQLSGYLQRLEVRDERRGQNENIDR